MKHKLTPWMERQRIDGDAGSGPYGAFRIAGPLGMTLLVVVSDGRDWADCDLPGTPWEHASVSLKGRAPTWQEMEFVRDELWEPVELVLQFSVPRDQHINEHPNCLHMWRPIGVEIALPPARTVA